MSTRQLGSPFDGGPNHFLLMSGAAHDLFGKRLKAFEVATTRLEAGLWPIFERTPNRRALRAGDLCLVYLTGRDLESQSIL